MMDGVDAFTQPGVIAASITYTPSGKQNSVTVAASLNVMKREFAVDNIVLDDSLAAARDLYATRWQAFRLILWPLMMPGIISGYLLAFIISLDDFIITNFVKGAGMETLPTAIFGSVKQGIKPNIMAISTMMLVVSVLFVTLSYLVNRIGQRTRS